MVVQQKGMRAQEVWSIDCCTNWANNGSGENPSKALLSQAVLMNMSWVVIFNNVYNENPSMLNSAKSTDFDACHENFVSVLVPNRFAT